MFAGASSQPEAVGFDVAGIDARMKRPKHRGDVCHRLAWWL